jgi:oxygen-independent coproporphyrinogen-3 oxidase
MQDRIKRALLSRNENVPRYTSYPPANFFTACGDDGAHRAALADLPQGQNISLYVHIPFCPKMCWFCGCHTQASGRYEPVADYLDLLIAEIGIVAAQVPKSARVAHLHFGGGSPTMLGTIDFERVMGVLSSAFIFSSDCQVAVEIDPRQVTADKLKTYAACGVSRVSLGVQDIDDRVMRAINRVQPFDLTRRVVDDCRGVGIEHINIDLVYGLPHQTVHGFEHTVQSVCALSPNRLAVFGYAHVPWMKKHMRLIADEDLPGASDRYDLFSVAWDTVCGRGYDLIGIDHFACADDSLALAARDGTMRRNFQGYVPAAEDLPIIGVGVSSISQLPQGYFQNTVHRPHYRDAVMQGQLPTARLHHMTDDDRMRARMIEQLMCYSTLDMAEYSGVNLDNTIHQFGPLVQDGLVSIEDGRKIVVHHPLAVRMVACVFDAYRQKVNGGQGPRHAVAV